MDALELLKKADADIQGDAAKSAYVFASKLQAALDSESDHNFELGVLYAAAQIVRLFDRPAMAANVICEAGLESVDCSALDEFEKQSLRKLSNERGIALRGL